jgi:hypothetical protein
MRNLWPIRYRAAAGLACAWLAYSAARQDARWLSEHANKEGHYHYYEGLLDQPNAKRAYEVLGFFVRRIGKASPRSPALPKTPRCRPDSMFRYRVWRIHRQS